jgi:hypothetical protein
MFRFCGANHLLSLMARACMVRINAWAYSRTSLPRLNMDIFLQYGGMASCSAYVLTATRRQCAVA